MSPRKQIYAILAAGILVILALLYAPYALVSRARQAVAAAVQPMPDSPALRELEKQVTAPPPFDVAGWYVERGEDPTRHAVIAESLDGRRVLADYNADTTFNPASLVKLTTTLAVLRRLGKDYRFETRVYADGTADKSGMLRGRLVVESDDPTFGDFHAAMIADELKARGVTRVPEEVSVTPDFTFNFSEKAEDSARNFARAVKLAPKKFTVGDAPAGLSPLFVLRSYPLRQILLYMNAHSNNFVAERLGRLAGGPEGVRRFLVEEVGLPADEVFLSTTSGLEHNRLTARGLLAVIRALQQETARQGLRLEDIMAVASDDWGTLRRRMVGTPLEGAVVAKTGTLVHDDGGMASLGGIAYTQQSGPVAFVVFNQGSTVAENRQLTDQLLVQIVMHQDQPALVRRPEERRRLLDRADLLVEKP